MRTNSHIIDTKAIKSTLNSIPDSWVVRELSERDYGIDLTIEIFHEYGKDQNQNITYESTGHTCHLQVKGTNQKLKVTSSNTINYSFKRKALLYVERFSIPFLLLRVDVSDEKAKSYFVWIQRYIKDVLDIEHPDWREKEQESYTIRIPAKNILTKNLQKIETISSRIKYIEELMEYREIYSSIQMMLPAIAMGNHSFKIETYKLLQEQINRVSRFSTLLVLNNSCVGKSSLIELLNLITDVYHNKKNKSEFLDYPHKVNLDLLFNEVDSVSLIEDFIAENDGETVY